MTVMLCQSVLQQASSVLPGEKTAGEEGHSVAGQLALNKKQGVSGQSGQAAQNVKIDKHHKDFHSKTLIKEAIQDNDFLKNLSSSQVRRLTVSKSYPLFRSRSSQMRCTRRRFLRAAT